MEPEPGSGGASAPYKPVSVMRMPSLGNQPLASQPFGSRNVEEENREDKTRTIKSGFPEQLQMRDRSPINRNERISYQESNTSRSRPVVRDNIPKQSSTTKLADLFQSVDSPQIREQPVKQVQPPLSPA